MVQSKNKLIECRRVTRGAEVRLDARRAVLRAGDKGGEGVHAVPLREVGEEEVGSVVVLSNALLVAGPVGEGDLLAETGGRDGAPAGNQPGRDLRDALVHPRVFRRVHLVVQQVLQLVPGQAGEGGRTRLHNMGVEIEHRAPVAEGEDPGRVVVGGSEVASGAVQGRDEHGDGRARHLARLLWNETECGLRYPWEDAVLKDRCQRFQLRSRDVQLTHDVPQRVRRHELERGADLVYSLPRKINNPEVLPMADVRRAERRRLCQSRVLARTEPLGQRHQIAGRRRRDMRDPCKD